ncbi:hypothetical protein MGYG_05465 [Nannizzia gypsea CBS 118893]|uniref:Uncharacterized protein n=1 Tax=Arthroderma gypseum (strain ATCC MYA-4604 / CBS 118893) TaxID=535722 RepID=E4UW24_ARTGP|nr:hypothetical protein MGYG_05465 [Nannizzia gypsea CBS 118893]EFR02472.1 hypothetical protein MGYG_05465 [Nannizzia gypsea CBS 118893]
MIFLALYLKQYASVSPLLVQQESFLFYRYTPLCHHLRILLKSFPAARHYHTSHLHLWFSSSLHLALLCDISITVAAPRTTWVFAWGEAAPMYHVGIRIDDSSGVPLNSLTLLTTVKMLSRPDNPREYQRFYGVGLVGLIVLAASYAIRIDISLYCKPSEVYKTKRHWGPDESTVPNVVALVQIAFELVQFNIPTTLPASPAAYL